MTFLDWFGTIIRQLSRLSFIGYVFAIYGSKTLLRNTIDIAMILAWIFCCGVSTAANGEPSGTDFILNGPVWVNANL